jgi:hypothetical protein
MPDSSTPPELIVLDALLETLRQTCRLNPSFDVRKAAIEREGKLEREKAQLLAKLQQQEVAVEAVPA